MGRRKDFQPVKSGQRGAVGFGFGGAVGFGGGDAAGGTAAVGFGSNNPLAASFSDEAFAADPLTAELQQHLKRLAKKDATTKRKALAELSALVDDTSEDAVTRAIIALPQWCYMYCKLTNDTVVQVRESAHTLMGVVARVVQAEIEPHVATVLPRWWISSYDPRSEARHSAESTLAATFPGRRINKALRLCHKPLFAELAEIFQSTPQTVVDIKAVDGLDVAKEMYERQVYCGLLALGGFIEKVVEVDKFDEGLRAGVSALLEPTSFWKLADSKFSQVRLGFYKLLPRLCQHMAAAVENRLDQVAPSILGAMGDKDAGNFSAIWPAILHLAKAVPRAWGHVDVRKVVLPRMWACLRSAAHGSWAVTYPAVLPWLSMLPRSVAVPEVAAELCAALWHPVVSGAVPSSAYPLVATTWAECAAHLISSAATASGSAVLSDENLATFVALPDPPKPEGRPSPEQIAELKAAKTARASFLKEVTERLGGEWTTKMAEKKLEEMQAALASSGEPEPEPVPPSDTSEEFYSVCLLDPSMERLSEGQPKIVECWAAAIAQQLGTRPALQSAHIDRLFGNVAALAIETLTSSDDDTSTTCIRWFVSLVRSFHRTSIAASLEPQAGLRLAQTVARAVLEASDQNLPRVVTLDLLAGLSAPPLTFNHAIPTDAAATTSEKLVDWLNKTAAGSPENNSVIKLLSAYLGIIEHLSSAAPEWDSCAASILAGAGGTQALSQLLRVSIDKGISIPVGVPSLDNLAASNSYLEQVFSEDGQSVVELLLLGQPLYTEPSAVKLCEWLTGSLYQQSPDSGTAFRNLHVLANGFLSAELPTDTECAELRAARARLIMQVFMLQVAVKCPVGGFANGPLRTSSECALRCSEMWNEHSASLLDPVEGAVAGAAWLEAVPSLVEQILAITLSPKLKSTDGKEEDVVAACVKLAGELLATSKCVSPQCLQSALGGLLKEVVPALSSAYGAVKDDKGLLWSRALGFVVGVTAAVHPVDLYLGADDDYRQWLLVELFLYGGLEPVRIEGRTKSYLQNSLASARLLSECDLREFWTGCCQGSLSTDGADPHDVAGDDFAIATVKLAQELSVSAADGRFAGLLTTLFPDKEGSRQGTTLTSSLVRRLNDAVVNPARKVLLEPAAAPPDDRTVQDASGILYSLLPHLPAAQGWGLARECADKLCNANCDDLAPNVRSALMLVAGHGLAIAALSGDSMLEETELARQRRATELSSEPESSDDDAGFEDVSESERELVDRLDRPGSTTVKSCIQDVLVTIRRETGSVQGDAFPRLGVVRIISASMATGVLVNSSDGANPSALEEWEFCVVQAIKAAKPPTGGNARNEWHTRVHRAGLELIVELLSKLQSAVGLLGEAQCVAFEDALTGAVYHQLVDEDADWSPGVWRSLAALLPAWTSPERTLMLGYTDELVMQLSHEQYHVRCEVYQMTMRLATTALSEMKRNGPEDTDDDELDEEDSLFMEDAQTRPEIVPEALCDLIRGDVPGPSELLTIPAYLFGWAVILQMVARAPVALRGELVEMVTEELPNTTESAAGRLLSALMTLLPLENSGRVGTPKTRKGTKAIANIPPLSVIREGGSAPEVAAALFSHALRQLPAMSRKWFNTLSRADHMLVEQYAALTVTPSIVKRELENMSETAGSMEGLEISASTVARVVSATYLHDDCNLGVEISLAEAHPLHVVSVNLKSHQGMSEGKSRKMLLSITTLLSHKVRCLSIPAALNPAPEPEPNLMCAKPTGWKRCGCDHNVETQP